MQSLFGFQGIRLKFLNIIVRGHRPKLFFYTCLYHSLSVKSRVNNIGCCRALQVKYCQMYGNENSDFKINLIAYYCFHNKSPKLISIKYLKNIQILAFCKKF